MRRRRWVWIAVSVFVLVVFAGLGFLRWPIAYFDAYTDVQIRLEGFRSHSVMVDGYRVHYFDGGDAGGFPVVLVHGLGSRAQAWRNLAPYITKAGYRVYMPDLIGYGDSAKPRNFSYSIPAEATVVIDFMHELGLQRVDLGGWSMGGWVVQLIAADDPQQIQRLMLFDSAGLHDRPAWNPAIFTPETPAQLNALNALLRPHPDPIPGFVAEAVLRRSKESDWIIHRALASMYTAGLSPDFDDRIT